MISTIVSSRLKKVNYVFAAITGNSRLENGVIIGKTVQTRRQKRRESYEIDRLVLEVFVRRFLKSNAAVGNANGT